MFLLINRQSTYFTSSAAKESGPLNSEVVRQGGVHEVVWL